MCLCWVFPNSKGVQMLLPYKKKAVSLDVPFFKNQRFYPKPKLQAEILNEEKKLCESTDVSTIPEAKLDQPIVPSLDLETEGD